MEELTRKPPRVSVGEILVAASLAGAKGGASSSSSSSSSSYFRKQQPSFNIHSLTGASLQDLVKYSAQGSSLSKARSKTLPPVRNPLAGAAFSAAEARADSSSSRSSSSVGKSGAAPPGAFASCSILARDFGATAVAEASYVKSYTKDLRTFQSPQVWIAKTLAEVSSLSDPSSHPSLPSHVSAAVVCHLLHEQPFSSSLRLPPPPALTRMNATRSLANSKLAADTREAFGTLVNERVVGELYKAVYCMGTGRTAANGACEEVAGRSGVIWRREGPGGDEGGM